MVVPVPLTLKRRAEEVIHDLLPKKSKERYNEEYKKFYSWLEKENVEHGSTLYSLVSLNVRGRLGQTPLHLASSSTSTLVGRYQACRFPSPDLVEMLLEVGADPDARDDAGNTPLHLAAANQPCPPALARVLLARGAHLDARDAHGRTFRDLLTGGQQLHHIVNPLRYTKLSCLAARALRDHDIAFRGQIPVSLEELVLQH